MKVEDLLADESFINYCKGSSQKDVAKWELFAQENPAHRGQIEVARRKYYELFAVLAASDQMTQEARLRQSLDSELTQPASVEAPVVNLYGERETRKKKKKSDFFSMLLKFTAAAMIILVAGYLVKNGVTSKKQISRSFISPNGERKTFQLSDGSVVMLNAGSKITIPEHYGVSTRDIYLEGEAFFDVKHNKDVPFIVHTETMDVKALGTAFNIKAYPGEKIAEASLVNGLVEVTLRNEDNLKVMLHPNEKVKSFYADENTSRWDSSAVPPPKNEIVVDHLVEPLSKNVSGELKEIAWTKNKLEFTNESFANISQMIERWYGVKVVFENEGLLQYKFTGTFEKEEIGTLLSILKESRNFNYEIIHGDTLTIKLYQ